MKKVIMILAFLSFIVPSLALAATIGGPDISIPEKGLYLKEQAIKKTLDRYEYNTNIKATVEAEFISNMDLEASSGATDGGIEGQNSMVKFSSNFNNIIEPYIKIGTSNFDANWTERGYFIEVGTDTGFVWGVGAKATIGESKNYGIKLTMDVQYRSLDLDPDDIEVAKTIFTTSQEKFEIKEWQVSLLASKKFILPAIIKDYYIVPYTGVTFLSTDVDIGFDAGGVTYSTGNAESDKQIGVVLGCDIMPSLSSWYLLNFEIKLINETAFSLGGTVKF